MADSRFQRAALLIAALATLHESLAVTARLLVSLAHDWGLSSMFAHEPAHRERDLKEMVNIVWQGLKAR